MAIAAPKLLLGVQKVQNGINLLQVVWHALRYSDLLLSYVYFSMRKHGLHLGF